MYWMGQENQTDEVIQTIKAVQSQFPKVGKEDAVLIMLMVLQILQMLTIL